jgi:hypothetical protein
VDSKAFVIAGFFLKELIYSVVRLSYRLDSAAQFPHYLFAGKLQHGIDYQIPISGASIGNKWNVL